MSKVLPDLLYTLTHEWVRVEGDVATIGISDYAQHSLGSIVYLEANEVGESVKLFQQFGVVESVKAASDLMSPVSGEIIEVNQEAIDDPEVINSDSYGNWIIKVKLSNPQELANLLDPETYQAECK